MKLMPLWPGLEPRPHSTFNISHHFINHIVTFQRWRVYRKTSLNSCLRCSSDLHDELASLRSSNHKCTSLFPWHARRASSKVLTGMWQTWVTAAPTKAPAPAASAGLPLKTLASRGSLVDSSATRTKPAERRVPVVCSIEKAEKNRNTPGIINVLSCTEGEASQYDR